MDVISLLQILPSYNELLAMWTYGLTYIFCISARFKATISNMFALNYSVYLIPALSYCH